MRRNLFSILILSAVGMAALIGVISKPPAAVHAEPEIYASPVHAGCYLARPDQCKIHVEPFTITVASGKKLVMFKLLASRVGSGTSTTIYDFRPDISNPLPISGSTVTPSRVAKDFAARCGETYSISLNGQDTGDAYVYNLGATGQFTCPEGTFVQSLPAVIR